MSKTITITSHKTFLYDTPEQIERGSYTYSYASAGVEYLLETIKKFNFHIVPIIKYVESQEAKVKLKGSKREIYNLICELIKTEFPISFDIHT